MTIELVMKQSISLIALLSMVLFACSSSNESVENNSITSEQVAQSNVVGNRLLTLEIEGMTCVMGCGGAIRSELAATNAIESCEFDFEQGRKKNVAKVAFDKDKISPEEIIAIVANLNDGQFAVGENQTQDISVNIRTRVEDVPSEQPEEAKMKVTSESGFEMPNFVEILASFLHN